MSSKRPLAEFSHLFLVVIGSHLNLTHKKLRFRKTKFHYLLISEELFKKLGPVALNPVKSGGAIETEYKFAS